MKLASAIGRYPAGRPLSADQVLEYHAARVLLLLHVCGTKDCIHGLTKLAKLDFFVRYPVFFRRAATALGFAATDDDGPTPTGDGAMVRHHYGPWDPRYYQVLTYLQSRELLTLTNEKKAFVFTLTEQGKRVAQQLARADSFGGLVGHMKSVKKVLGPKSGDALKKLVYSLFDEEVAQLSRGQVIR